MAWTPVDNTESPPSEHENDALKKCGEVLWRNAVEAGIVLFELCGKGALEQEPRIKNVILHALSELKTCLDNFSVPYSHTVLNLRYNLQVGRSYHVYFAKIFEGFCKVYPKSEADHRIFESYYIDLKQKATLHVRLLRAFSHSLKDRFGKSSEPLAPPLRPQGPDLSDKG